jgi:hypothetical protein
VAIVLLLELLAEKKLEEAARAGAFDNLPGAGKPLVLDDDRLIPEDLRVAYRILKNAGFVPPELDARREAAGLRRLLAAATDDGERKKAAARLALIEAALEARGRGRLPRDDDYRERIVAKLDRPR